MPPASLAPAAARYRLRLATSRAGLLVLVRALFAGLFDPRTSAMTLGRIGAVAGVAIVQAQFGAVMSARQFLLAVAGPPAWRIPAGLVGSSAAGVPLLDLAGRLPAVYRARILAGASELVAQQTAQASLSRLAASEPYRVANATILDAARYDERYTGRYDRVTRAGACPFCTEIRDRGYTPAVAGLAAHANCQCVAAPEVRNPR